MEVPSESPEGCPQVSTLRSRRSCGLRSDFVQAAFDCSEKRATLRKNEAGVALHLDTALPPEKSTLTQPEASRQLLLESASLWLRQQVAESLRCGVHFQGARNFNSKPAPLGYYEPVCGLGHYEPVCLGHGYLVARSDHQAGIYSWVHWILAIYSEARSHTSCVNKLATGVCQELAGVGLKRADAKNLSLSLISLSVVEQWPKPDTGGIHHGHWPHRSTMQIGCPW